MLPPKKLSALRTQYVAEHAPSIFAGIVFNEHTDEDGATVFEHACRLVLRACVETAHCALQVRAIADWLKVKNPNSPAMQRARAAVVVNRQHYELG